MSLMPDPANRPRLRHLPWLALGWSAVALGFAGVVLPILPTTPFLILAAFAFSKSSPRLRQWLVDHQIFGGPIRDWEENGAIRPRYKVMACTAMALVLLVSVLSSFSGTVILIQLIAMGSAAAFILSRPNGD
ncbi:YbaN family protein [Nioella aestuarii]|uniref:YbaN family protein n=1 Tax=Nioella aestuarii TaxID=1662864 RepID=UPI003D7F6ADC